MFLLLSYHTETHPHDGVKNSKMGQIFGHQPTEEDTRRRDQKVESQRHFIRGIADARADSPSLPPLKCEIGIQSGPQAQEMAHAGALSTVHTSAEVSRPRKQAMRTPHPEPSPRKPMPADNGQRAKEAGTQVPPPWDKIATATHKLTDNIEVERARRGLSAGGECARMLVNLARTEWVYRFCSSQLRSPLCRTRLPMLLRRCKGEPRVSAQCLITLPSLSTGVALSKRYEHRGHGCCRACEGAYSQSHADSCLLWRHFTSVTAGHAIDS